MTQALKTIIAARVRTARKMRGLTQASLADTIGRTVEAVSNIERALSLPPLDLLQRLADALDIDLTDLLMAASAAPASGERAELEMRIRLSGSALSLERLRIAATQIEALREGDAPDRVR